MKKVALITNYNISEKLSAAMRVADRIAPRVESILLPVAYKERVMRSKNHRKEFEYRTPEEIYSLSEVIFVLGGDGAMLDAARRAAPAGIPILGINMGRVGYMSELEMDELALLDRVFDGAYRMDERIMLRAEVRSSSGQSKFSAYALNEAAITNGSAARIVDLELADGNELVYTYRADGLVIATPTGSTAYSLSAGGPIVDPKLSCLCVTPICPHSLLARPLVFPDTAELRVKNICAREKVLHLTVDGRSTFDLYFGDTVVVTRSERTVKLLRIKEESFYSKIRMKKFV
ncbi:MAG: NAD(+)/NADH kinase [Clostridia bacterium]|nr:NAD(+)/NADH kinase [Clostridia bacterium]